MATKSSRSPIDTYLAELESPAARRTLTALRTQLRRLLPTATETLSYGMPAYRLPSGKVAAGFAFFGRNCGYYPHSGNVVPKLGRELAGLKTTKGGVTFPPDMALPAAAVKALVATRLAELGDGQVGTKGRGTRTGTKPPVKRASTTSPVKRAGTRAGGVGAAAGPAVARGRRTQRPS